jgi:hypothetical protein
MAYAHWLIVPRTFPLTVISGITKQDYQAGSLNFNAPDSYSVRSEEKRPLGRPRRRWADNIRMDLGEIGWGDVDWIGLAQDTDT